MTLLTKKLLFDNMETTQGDIKYLIVVTSTRDFLGQKYQYPPKVKGISREEFFRIMDKISKLNGRSF